MKTIVLLCLLLLAGCAEPTNPTRRMLIVKDATGEVILRRPYHSYWLVIDDGVITSPTNRDNLAYCLPPGAFAELVDEPIDMRK